MEPYRHAGCRKNDGIQWINRDTANHAKVLVVRHIVVADLEGCFARHGNGFGPRVAQAEIERGMETAQEYDVGQQLWVVLRAADDAGNLLRQREIARGDCSREQRIDASVEQSEIL